MVSPQAMVRDMVTLDLNRRYPRARCIQKEELIANS